MMTEGFLLYDTDGWNFLWWSTKEINSYEANQLSMKGAMFFMRHKQQFQVSCKLDNLASRYHPTTGTTMMKDLHAAPDLCFLGCSSPTISVFLMCCGLFFSPDTLVFHVVAVK